jgi:xanthine dehydrogenase YagS FAD-binding subunit
VNPIANVNARDVKDAVDSLVRVRKQGRQVSVTGGGTDLLGMMKERLVRPDVLVNLKTIRGLSGIAADASGVRIGALTTLATLGSDPVITTRYPLLAEAANSVGTPQIRNLATLGGNICQRPWCWYFRNAFPCYKNGGSRCFAPTGENQLHAIFGGGPSYIVHPSDTAPALVALDARIRIAGPAGERIVPAADFFALPKLNPARENVLADDEVVAEILIPPPAPSSRSTYRKLLDREAWTHAVVSAAVTLQMEGAICRDARIVLGGVAPIPWDRPRAAEVLRGKRLSPEVAAEAARIAVEDARPMTKNAYKVALTSALIRRTLVSLAENGNG